MAAASGSGHSGNQMNFIAVGHPRLTLKGPPLGCTNMFRTIILVAVVVSLSGCEAMAEAARQQEEQRQAQEAALQSRIAQLTPEQKDSVQRCYAESVGRIKTLRNAGQGASTSGMNDYTVVNACLNNPYFYATIPAPAVVINTPPPSPDGGLSLYQQCLAAQAVGAGACP